jgi:hypothetical protein
MKIKILIISLFVFSSNVYGGVPNEIQTIIEKEFKEYRIANRTDFSPEFDVLLKNWEGAKNKLNTIVQADFNNDGKTDYVVIIISKKIKKFSFIAFLSEDKGFKYYNIKTHNFPKNHDGSIWETMWLKPKGAPGLSEEEYFNAPDGVNYPYLGDHTKKDIQKYEAAVKKYVDMNVLEKTALQSPESIEWDDLFFCEEAFYFESGGFKRLEKCD